MANLINLEKVSKAYGIRPLLSEVSLGISVGDCGAAVYATIGTLAALYERQATGQGRIVETSLFDALSEWMGYPMHYTKYGGYPPARAGVRHATVVPYGSYRCQDGAVLYESADTRIFLPFQAAALMMMTLGTGVFLLWSRRLGRWPFRG